jgi:hypothetical protein
MTLRTKLCGESYLCQTCVRVSELSLRKLDSQIAQILANRAFVEVFESAYQVNAMYADEFCDFAQPKIIGKEPAPATRA